MNKERRNAYFQLINALLTCASDEQPEILNANSDLIDADLLLIMARVSVLEMRGDQNSASKLQHLVSQLASVVGNSSVQTQIEADKLLVQGEKQAQSSQFKDALQSFQQALSIYQTLGDCWGKGAALGNLGFVYDVIGDYVKEIECHQRALSIALKIGNRKGYGFIQGNLGLAYRSVGDYSKAIECHQQNLDIAREINDPKGEGTALGNLGLAYFDLGYYEQAAEYLQQALFIAQEIDDPWGEGIILGNLGEAYRNLGDYGKAINYQQQRLEIAQKIGNPQGQAQALSNLGLAYLEIKDYARAIDYQHQSLAIKQSIGDRPGEGKVLNNLGAAFLRSGHLVKAENILHLGMQVRESLRVGLEDIHKVSIFDTQASTYRLLQEVLIAQNKNREAIEIAERGRGRAFVELLAERLSSQSSDRVSITPPTIEQIQQIAQTQKSTIVEYSIVYSDKLFTWVIKPNGEIFFRQVDLESLKQPKTSLSELVNQARESVVDGKKRGDAPRLLQQLHKLLIQPITDLLPDNPEEPVIFIPQLFLFLVPFAALLDAKTGKFLIEQHTILIAPSIQVLDSTRKRQQHLKDEWASKKDEKNSDFYLVVGNPTMPSIAPEIGQPPEQLEQLEGAEEQARTIAKLLDTQPIIRDQATKVNVVQRMLNARLIHLATHGLLNDIRELGVPGAIALAPTEGVDNGFLTAGEILERKLKAELVVLSACLTGLGKVTGDGVVGLSRCLFLAGVPSVIVSLWSVPDEPTQYLMIEFYGNFLGGMNKAKSLRQAILTTKQKFRSPVNWAGFTLIGEAE